VTTFSKNVDLTFERGISTARPWVFETILISILLEQEKALVELREKVEDREK